jgi:hypothetical protein
MGDVAPTVNVFQAFLQFIVPFFSSWGVLTDNISAKPRQPLDTFVQHRPWSRETTVPFSSWWGGPTFNN